MSDVSQETSRSDAGAERMEETTTGAGGSAPPPELVGLDPPDGDGHASSVYCADYVFTCNNFTAVDIAHLRRLFASGESTSIVYVGWAEEHTLPGEGTPHLQGLLCFRGRGVRFSTAKSLLGKRFHLEFRAAPTNARARQYFADPGSFEHKSTAGPPRNLVELGTLPERDPCKYIRDRNASNKRGKVAAELAEFLSDHDTMGLIPAVKRHSAFYLRYSRGIKDLVSLTRYVDRNMETPPQVWWLHGDTGLGKTFSVFKHFGQENVYKKNCAHKWFDGYRQQKVLLLDELRSTSWCRYEELLAITDCYPFTVETKNGTIPLNSPVIVITSPLSPVLTYQGNKDEDDCAQLLRRLGNRVIKFNSPRVDSFNPFDGQ